MSESVLKKKTQKNYRIALCVSLYGVVTARAVFDQWQAACQSEIESAPTRNGSSKKTAATQMETILVIVHPKILDSLKQSMTKIAHELGYSQVIDIGVLLEDYLQQSFHLDSFKESLGTLKKIHQVFSFIDWNHDRVVVTKRHDPCYYSSILLDYVFCDYQLAQIPESAFDSDFKVQCMGWRARLKRSWSRTKYTFLDGGRLLWRSVWEPRIIPYNRHRFHSWFPLRGTRFNIYTGPTERQLAGAIAKLLRTLSHLGTIGPETKVIFLGTNILFDKKVPAFFDLEFECDMYNRIAHALVEKHDFSLDQFLYKPHPRTAEEVCQKKAKLLNFAVLSGQDNSLIDFDFVRSDPNTIVCSYLSDALLTAKLTYHLKAVNIAFQPSIPGFAFLMHNQICRNFQIPNIAYDTTNRVVSLVEES